MKSTATHLAIALIAGTAASAQDRGDDRPAPPPQGAPVPPLLAIFDKDRDGKISAREISKADKALATLDRNNDGEITREELQAPPPPPGNPGPKDNKPPGPRHGPPPVIAALDSDKDGSISTEELEAAHESLLTLDKDGDGVLSPQELFPHGPPPPPPGRPEHRPDSRDDAE